MTWQTNSIASAGTERLGELLGKSLKPPVVLELRSDLGGGKTTFVRGLARGLGSQDPVTSPSFTLKQIYKAKNGVKISHHDFYRLDEAGIMADELAESLEDKKTITIIEWADIIANVLPESRLTVEFKITANNSEERQIIFYYPDSLIGAMEKLKTDWARIQP